LIAQSLLNQGRENVLYLCATIDLVLQTEKEADRLGIKCTTRIGKIFSNNEFELGRAICITTYQALFNKLSVFKKDKYPSAIVFDDAHVSEPMLRGAFSLRINRGEHPEFFERTYEWIKRGARVGGLADRLEGAMASPPTSGPFLVPPIYVFDHSDELKRLIKDGVSRDNPEQFFPYLYIIENLQHCACFIHGGAIEISPPFIPAKALQPLAANDIERVFLSATLTSQSDFARAFGRKPSEVIRADDDAGNGERLILFGSDAEAGAVRGAAQSLLGAGHKVLVAVPSARRAQAWAEVGVPPTQSEFSGKLEKFRNADRGSFLLVGRFDGIDLPDAQCRIMVIDGVPSTASLLEGYQYESLGMRKAFINRTASRFTQLFGRINRGRKDYGAFLVNDRTTSLWLRKKKHFAYLPPILRQQIQLGESIHSDRGVPLSEEEISTTCLQVLDRDEGWKDYYRDHLSSADVSLKLSEEIDADERVYIDAARSEAAFMSAVWNGQYDVAISSLEAGVEGLSQVDPTLAGWHLLWLGMAYYWSGKHAPARRCFREAHARLGVALPVPRSLYEFKSEVGREPQSSIEAGLRKFLGDDVLEINRKIARSRNAVAPIGDPAASFRQAEEAARSLGDLLGYRAKRPDNENEVGPDVVWIDELQRKLWSFELKTDKVKSSQLTKSDIGQSHNHIAWVKAEYKTYQHVAHFIVTDAANVSSKASVDDIMVTVTAVELATCWEDYCSVIDALKHRSPTEQLEGVAHAMNAVQWKLQGVALI
tara:strand:+ start:869 stop:3166 length:2298 start_codon:yes stop_codon:yes gene_type:complete